MSFVLVLNGFLFFLDTAVSFIFDHSKMPMMCRSPIQYGVKCQGHQYLKATLQLVTRTPFSPTGFHIYGMEITTKVSDIFTLMFKYTYHILLSIF